LRKNVIIETRIQEPKEELSKELISDIYAKLNFLAKNASDNESVNHKARIEELQNQVAFMALNRTDMEK
jgi:hypothetical protein